MKKHNPKTHLVPNILRAALGKKKELEIFGDDYPTPDGTCIRDYVHVEDDMPRALSCAGKDEKGDGNSVFNLGTGKGYSVKQVVAAAEKVTEKKIAFKISPRRPGDPARLVASFAKAENVLGWKPENSLESILRSAWEWEKKGLVPRQ